MIGYNYPNRGIDVIKQIIYKIEFNLGQDTEEKDK